MELGVKNIGTCQGQAALVMDWDGSPARMFSRCVDEGYLIEADENNNNATLSVTVRDYPDLVASVNSLGRCPAVTKAP